MEKQPVIKGNAFDQFGDEVVSTIPIKSGRAFIALISIKFVQKAQEEISELTDEISALAKQIVKCKESGKAISHVQNLVDLRTQIETRRAELEVEKESHEFTVKLLERLYRDI